LCTTVSDAPGLAAKFSVAAWLATMASDSGRRPKGVVGCVCMIRCLVQAKEICSPKRRRLLTAIRGSVILLVADFEKGFRAETFRGPFSVAIVILCLIR
jgi:hypothetical protein